MPLDVVRYVKEQLKQRYRDSSFVVPVAMVEAPVATQLPGLVEKQNEAPQMPAMAFQGPQSALPSPPPMDALAGLQEGSPGALPPAGQAPVSPPHTAFTQSAQQQADQRRQLTGPDVAHTLLAQ